MRWGIQARIGASLAAALVVFAVTAVLFYRNSRELVETSRRVEHTYDVLFTLDALELAVKDVETGQRGYLLTGNESFLEPYQQAFSTISGQLQRLRDLTSDNAEQLRRIPRLEEALRQRVQISQEIVGLRRADRVSEANELVASGRGLRMMQTVQARIAEMEQAERGLLRQRDLEAEESAANVQRTMVLSLVLTLGLFLLVLFALTKYLEESRRAATILQHNREELAGLSARLTAVLDSATQVAIIATDLQGVITVFNKGAEQMLGYRAEEVIGKMTPERIHLAFEMEQRAKELSQELGRAVGGFDVFATYAKKSGYDKREWTYVRKDGSHLTVSLAVTVLRDSGGTPRGFLGVASDVTMRRQAEEELRRARDAADEASRAKSEFLANMSHEIRTPLNAVIGMTRLVLDTPLNKEQKEYLEIAKSSADALLGSINDVLDLSKIEARHLQLDAAVFDLREALGDAMKTMALQAHQKHLELVFGVSPEVPDFVVGDEKRLRQVIVNLVGNAIKFTEHGEVAARVDLASRAATEATLRFEIRDTGIGISKDKQKSVFAPFVQADSSTSRRYGGTGLGLAISDHLVRRMGGEIVLESVEGQGSTFSFTLRFGLSEIHPRRRAAARRISLNQVEVCVVDDNRTNLLLLEKMVARWEMVPRAFGSGEAALEALNHAAAEGVAIPLLITDMVMPLGMDGIALLKEVRRNPALADLRTIVLSSSERAVSRQLQEELGITACITKPAKPSELMNAIMTALGEEVAEGAALAGAPVSAAPERSLKILVAEDIPVNQLLAVRLLEGKGHAVVVANNGSEALAALERESFDLALMDLQMPGMDGYEATRRIRERERGRAGHLPIIAMTADAFETDRERCLAEGMNGFVAKPIEPETLYRAISVAVSHLTGADHAIRITVPEDTAAVFDEEGALQRAGGDPQVLREMAGIFLEESPKLLSAVRTAAASNDADELERAAHAMKGAVGHFSSGEPYQATARLQRKGMEKNFAGAEEDLRLLERELERLHDALTRYMGGQSL